MPPTFCMTERAATTELVCGSSLEPGCIVCDVNHTLSPYDLNMALRRKEKKKGIRQKNIYDNIDTKVLSSGQRNSGTEL